MTEQFVAFITNHWVLSSLFALALVALIIHEVVSGRFGAAEVTPERAIQLINHEKATVLDLRSETLFSQGHILGALHVLPSALGKKMGVLEKHIGKPLVVVCATDQESQKACDQLRKKGFQIFLLNGGLENWKTTGLPLVKS